MHALKKELTQLNDYGIIIYTPQKDKPQITLLQNRMYADSYAVNAANYLERKKNFEQRVAAITNYVNNTVSCRSKLISIYFNAPGANDCGKCDNCINQKAIIITKEEFEKISSAILLLIKDTGMPVKGIQNILKDVKKEKLWKVINFLQAENKINADKEGNIFM